MVRITLDNLIPSSLPDGGWVVRYRIKGAVTGYLNPPTFFSLPIIIDTADPAGTLYEGTIKRDCGVLESDEITWVTPCDCASGFNPVGDGSSCFAVQSTAATVTNSGYCLAKQTNGAYSNYESRIYLPGFTDTTLGLPPGTSNTYIQFRLTLGPQWANPTNNVNLGPMNRAGVWIDSDCNGTPNGLSLGTSTTVGYIYNNPGSAKTVYVGIAGDNMFILKVNGTTIAACGQPSTPTFATDRPFRIWHIIPVTVQPGINYFNAVATGDGNIQDAIAMVIYNNTADQIAAATADGQLSILFTTENLRGTSFDVATCPDTYSLDTSGGAGTYICRKTSSKVCNSFDI